MSEAAFQLQPSTVPINIEAWAVTADRYNHLKKLAIGMAIADDCSLARSWPEQWSLPSDIPQPDDLERTVYHLQQKERNSRDRMPRWGDTFKSFDELQPDATENFLETVANAALSSPRVRRSERIFLSHAIDSLQKAIMTGARYGSPGVPYSPIRGDSGKDWLHISLGLSRKPGVRGSEDLRVRFTKDDGQYTDATITHTAIDRDSLRREERSLTVTDEDVARVNATIDRLRDVVFRLGRFDQTVN